MRRPGQGSTSQESPGGPRVCSLQSLRSPLLPGVQSGQLKQHLSRRGRHSITGLPAVSEPRRTLLLQKERGGQDGHSGGRASVSGSACGIFNTVTNGETWLKSVDGLDRGPVQFA